MSDSARILVVARGDEGNLIKDALVRSNLPLQVESSMPDSVGDFQLGPASYFAVVVDERCISANSMNAILEKNADTPIVVVTDAERTVADTAGKQYVFSKSDYLHELPAAIQNLLRESNRSPAAEQHATADSSGLARARMGKPISSSLDHRLQTLCDGMPEAIFEVDTSGMLTFVNRKFAELAQCAATELLNRPYCQILCKKESLCHDCPVAKTMISGEPLQAERQFGEKFFDLSSYPILGSDGDLFSIAVYCKDITERKCLEKQLLQTEKLATIGLLASGIAHELRNPLNIIETARYYIEAFLTEPHSETQSKLDIMKRSIERSSRIIDNLLEFARPADDDLAVIPLKPLIDATIAIIGKELDARNIDFEVVGDEDLLAFAKVSDLKQILLNLVINSIQAMPQGGSLALRVSQAGPDWVEIRISDTGVGIPEENIPHIFSPFFTTKGVGEGTGLGLYLTHMLLHRAGGRIEVQSNGGKGTTFIVSIPPAPQSQNTQ